MSTDGQSVGLPNYNHIDRNEFVHRRHKNQKEEEIIVCTCRYDPNAPESACGERCLNVLTSTECTPGYCPCDSHCKNQRFQKCENAKIKLFQTEGRGWGLIADEDIMTGQFIIEYCGEVISWDEAKKRSCIYEAEGLKDAYIISLDAGESIDATRKGSLARFINHSCQSNCETRKWTVLGEVRVGIFAKQAISVGTELSYDYNFEWYGGATVRCLCGALCCSGFLGAKSRGFQEANHLWEENDDRYSVEKVPLYDSEEEDIASTPEINNDLSLVKQEMNYSSVSNVFDGDGSCDALSVEPICYIPPGGDIVKMESQTASEELYPQKNAMISRIRSNSACRNYHIDPSPASTRVPQYPSGRSKTHVRRQVDVKTIGERLASKEARDELFALEEIKNQATCQLDSLYNEIRPAIEEHERDSQDHVSTSVAEKWIEASTNKLKADFDLFSSVIRNIAYTPRKPKENAYPKREDGEDGTKLKEIGGEQTT
ncbi:Histone-lysine N-methyltransferase [Zostera marina]|uniref:Histone-lysine N-methyltransferase n=1 Tax=Zostera marina TaxID=29655 RepID=A0A0K9P7Y1_ZOSMR|nr:Histone-lysine N-methyltransferase [Zostera marina]